MKRLLLIKFVTSLLLCFVTSVHAEEAKVPVYDRGINIIPMPKSLVQRSGQWILGRRAKFVTTDARARAIAELFASKIRRATGYALPIVERGNSSAGSIVLGIDSTLQVGEEGYRLVSSERGVSIVGRTPQGLFYGLESLLQLLPAEIESPRRVDSIVWRVPAVEIVDEPAFAYRGLHLDPCRHFLTVEQTKRYIDAMAMAKLNRMHWHLTEDQGWRIEIKKYPRLTEVGSKRIEPDGSVYGGYYTQEEIRDIVRYAEERFVTIIPEIELPGHAMGAITAYPWLACNPKTQQGKDYTVRSIWGVEEDVYCAGKEEVFDFIRDVFDEVTALFPSEYFHIGGDECPKKRWAKCSLCQKRIHDEGLSGEEELQSYVIRRAQKLLAQHGKKLIGWEEILEGGLAPSATVMSWKGERSGIKSANMGHDVVMTPADQGLYLNRYQGDSKIEPVAPCCSARLEQTYYYNPVPHDIAPDKRHHILGAQACLWSEYFYNNRLQEYHAYPASLALAEAVWTPMEKRNFEDFVRRVDNAYVRLDGMNLNYHIPLPEQPNGSCNHVAFVDSTWLELRTSRPIKVVYTLDGSDPTAHSMEYEHPILVTESLVAKVASVLPSGRLSSVRAIVFDKQGFSQATNLVEVKAGLWARTSVGNYGEAKDFASAHNWEVTYIDKVEQIIPDKMLNSLDELTRKAVVAEGYIYVPRDGVYFFSTNYDECYIDGKLIINNAGEVKRFSRHDSSVALQAGYHPIKIVFVGAIHGGFPSYWADPRVYMRFADSGDWHAVETFTGKVM